MVDAQAGFQPAQQVQQPYTMVRDGRGKYSLARVDSSAAVLGTLATIGLATRNIHLLPANVDLQRLGHGQPAYPCQRFYRACVACLRSIHTPIPILP